MDRDKSRTHRLNNLLHKVLSGETTISPHNGPIFLEALYTQPDPAKCLGNLKSNSFGLSALKAAIRFNLSSKFLNTHASALIRYLQSPEVKVINNGDFLVDILNDIVDPPIFWVEFRKAFLQGELDEDAKFSFGWLLLQLCLSSAATSSGYREDPDMPLILDALLSSTVGKIKDIGVKLQETLLTSIPCSDIIDTGEHAPGGRHNNDFADFRKISILPTGEELECTETPFLRPSSVLEDPQTEYSRVAIHLDNQFRLLREDMINELREELQIALGTKRGRHRGTKVKGLKLIGINLGDDRKRIRWSLAFQCKEDFPEMKKLKQDTKARKEFLSNKRQFFKHQSLACLLAGKEILTFPTIHRDEDRLAKSPPEIVLQFEDAESTREALRRLKLEDDITLIQVDTAVFAYEPILRGLQQASTLPLSSEILLWKDGNAPGELEASQQCSAVVQLLRSSPSANLKTLLQTAKDIQLDSSQAASLISGLSQKVSLIQGPPGTGKSFIGALIAKSIHDFSERTILVVCYTNHALDDILTGLLDIGISSTSMLRLGGKSTSKTEPLTMRNQARGQYKRSQTEWKIIDELKVQLETLRRAVEASYRRYEASNPSFSMILDYLEIEDPEYFAAFRMPESEEGMTLVGGQGKEAQSDYLFNRWSQGEDAGSLKDSISETHNLGPWKLTKEERRALMSRWKDELMKECIQEFCDNSNEYNRCCERLNRAFSAENASILRSKRIVGCTTTAAAMYREEIQTFNPDVLLVEEAGEILESHVLTALGPQASQMVLIGDHKQLRPKVNHYLLTVEKGEGYDLNRSLFERLILKNYPHLSLSQQHRMRPEISTLVRSLTYPELVDAPKTKNRPNILGMQDNIVFLHHEHPEDVDPRIGDRNDMGSTSSKQNSFEVDMILKIVKYLAQQGYGTDQLVILTPYLGQLHRLRDVLKSITDPILNDLDSYELVRAGLITPAAAKLTRKPIRLATIDNYQGEESDIVLVSLTRSNSQCDIGFMASPERLNVLLSRARNGLIMVGNGNTFKNARKGKELWCQLFGLLHDGNHMYQGLPIRCENHPNTKALLTQVAEFDEISPDGGCTLPCGVLLSCNLHSCPSKCHQLSDHSKLICKEMMTSKCSNGHAHTWPCGKGAPLTCNKCEREQKLARQKQQNELEAQERRDSEQKAHLAMMDSLNKQIEEEKIRQEDERLAEERRKALAQKRNDLAAMQANRTFTSSRQPAQSTTYNIVSSGSIDGRDITNVAPPTKASDPEPSSMNFTSNRAPIPQAPKSPILNKMLDTVSSLFVPFKTSVDTAAVRRTEPKDGGKQFKDLAESQAKQEWDTQKMVDGASNDSIDSIMGMIGLESVKAQVMAIKNKIDTSIRQNSSLKKERFNAVFLGNPGTGKTTIARHYAKFLSSVRVTPGDVFEETTGASLAEESVKGAKDLVQKVIKAGGGTIFIDEAYQLTNGNSYGGAAVLDFLLAEMENNVGTIVFILAGYSKEMEKFFEHNPGLKSRVPHEFKFADYEDEELMSIFEGMFKQMFRGNMKVEGGIRGLYGRVVIRRLGRRRGQPGFGNARELQTVFARIRARQATRLTQERRDGKLPDDFLMTCEDLIGPNPAIATRQSKAWEALQKMIGIKSVKDSVKSLFAIVEENYQRELSEKEPMEMSLNRVFLGSPGTGKTTVAKLYGQILADIGLLSNGEVVIKNPADFVGAVLGASESNTKAILANSVGKVLIIDEAYMLYGGGTNDGQQGGGSSSNQFKTSVIDTIVAEVQNVPGEDRCVLLLGYKEQMLEMFQNVNPGLSRRFKIEDAFNFEDFNETELLLILELKLKQQDLDATADAKKVALERLNQMRNRPNFGNAGEVENLITQAKPRAIARRLEIPLSRRDADIVFLPEDFDPDWNRAATASMDLAALFSDVVGCDEIIQKLENYQKVAQTCKAANKKPQDLVPTNFVFSGPPGTGKTTVARKLGKVFYNMGMLGSDEVIECSASDLVGQFVGQTGPKTKKLFERALGKVLFIDEAYRLSQGHFSQEAVDEVVGLLTHPAFKSKLIVILAGYERDMSHLMSVNTGLSSRFPEQIFFNNMDAQSCLKVIECELKKMEVTIGDQDVIQVEMTELIRDLSELRDWGNARDMVTISKAMIQRAFSSGSTMLSGEDALDELRKFVADRQRRSNIPPVARRVDSDLPVQSFTRDPQPPPSLATSTEGAPPPVNPAPRSSPPNARGENRPAHTRGRGGNRGRGNGRAVEQPSHVAEVGRDPGVSDSIWRQMKAAKRAGDEIERKAKQEIDRLHKERAAQRRQEEEHKKQVLELEKAEAAARDAAQRAELLRQREEAKRKQLAARAEKERIAAALRAKEEQEAQRKAKEVRAQQKLREMGVCVAGYQWRRMGSVYRCQGGSHTVSVDSLGL